MARRTRITLADEDGPEETLRALDASFGAWADRTEDGASHVEGLRGGLARRLAAGARDALHGAAASTW